MSPERSWGGRFSAALFFVPQKLHPEAFFHYLGDVVGIEADALDDALARLEHDTFEATLLGLAERQGFRVVRRGSVDTPLAAEIYGYTMVDEGAPRAT